MKSTLHIYSINYLATLIVLLAFTLTAPAAIVNVGFWHLGEPGTVGSSSPYTPLYNSGTGGSGQDITGSQITPGTTVSIVTSGLAAPGSTAALQLTQGSGASGIFSGATPFSFNNNFGMEVWVNPAAGESGGYDDIMTTANNSGAMKIGFYLGSWSGAINGSIFATSATPATNNQWMPVAIICSNGVSTLYVNGVAQSGTSSTTPVVENPMLFFGPGGNSPFSGILDEARIFTFNPATDNPVTNLSTISLLPPSITTQPQAPAGPIYSGQPLILTVTAAGSAPLTYFWCINGSIVSTATYPGFTNYPTTGTYAYDVIVSNSANTVTSTPPLNLTVLSDAPTIAVDLPANLTVYAGGTVTLNPTVDGLGTLDYQWQSNGAPIVGATGTNFIIPDIPAGYSNSAFGVVVSNQYGTNNSTATVVDVLTPVPSSYTAMVASLNPLSYWRFNESSGTIAYDDWGGNNGVYVNAFGGQLPGALLYDDEGCALVAGSGSHIIVSNPAAFDFTANPFTFAGWFNVSSFPCCGNAARIFSNRQVPSGGYGIGIVDNNTVTFTAFGVIGCNAAVSPSLNAGQWYHVACVSTGTSVQIYLNGAFLANFDGVTINDNGDIPLQFGGNFDTGLGGEPFSGYIDDFAFFPYALSGANIASLYAAVAGAPPQFNSIVSSGSTLTIVSSGAANANCMLLSRTTLAPPNWVAIATNQIGSSGLFTNTITINPAQPGTFYLLSTQP